MIIGVGTDIVEVKRMEAALARRGEALARRLLHPEEFSLWQEKQASAAWLAKRFAAKEALLKALGTGLGRGLSWQHMCVLPNAFGRPEVTWDSAVLQHLPSMHLGQLRTHLSISDERDYVLAFAVLEQLEVSG
ncbi:MAG TPA: holo-ACP synthase [Alcanivoracaceae bacterium]|nr:holo-ACP synthase [Alcanivoracaceae bacterium]